MSDLFKLKINYVILSTDIPNNKKYILSRNNENIELPSLDGNYENTKHLHNSVIEYAKQLTQVDDIELMPQLISFNDEFLLDKESDTLYVVYGFVISLSTDLKDCYWKEFNYYEPNHYSNLIFKVIQNLT